MDGRVLGCQFPSVQMCRDSSVYTLPSLIQTSTTFYLPYSIAHLPYCFTHNTPAAHPFSHLPAASPSSIRSRRHISFRAAGSPTPSALRTSLSAPVIRHHHPLHCIALHQRTPGPGYGFMRSFPPSVFPGRPISCKQKINQKLVRPAPPSPSLFSHCPTQLRTPAAYHGRLTAQRRGYIPYLPDLQGIGV